MELVKALKLTSSDDESITINLSTECIPLDLSLYVAYWEVRRSMQATPVLTKVSTSSDIFIDVDNNAITVFIQAEDSKYLYGEYLQYLYIVGIDTGKKTSLIYGPVTFMEGFDTVFPEVHYCTPEDVAMQLKMLNSDGSRMVFTETTNPKRSDVIEMILQAEANIDRDTRNSWLINTASEEYHDIRMPLAGLPLADTVISLRNANIREIDITKGDKIEFWNGSNWENFALAASSRGNTWWIDYKIGQLHLNNLWPWFYVGANRVRVTYRWGYSTVPNDIKEACIKMVSIRLLQSDFNKLYIMNQKPNVDWNTIIETWKKDIEKIEINHKRTIFSFVLR